MPQPGESLKCSVEVVFASAEEQRAAASVLVTKSPSALCLDGSWLL